MNIGGNLLWFMVCVALFAGCNADTPKLGLGDPPKIVIAYAEGGIAKVKTMTGINNLINEENGCGQTSIFYAIQFKSRDLTDYLMSFEGLWVDKHDCDGDTPIMKAAFNGDIDTVKMLVDRGASVDAKNHAGIGVGHCAVASGNYNLIDYLIAFAGRGLMLQKSNDGATPLDIAIRMNRTDIINLLLNKNEE